MEQKSILSQGIKVGLIAAIVSIAVTLIAFILSANMLSISFMVLNIVILIGVMIYGLLNFRKANGGYMSFAQGLGVVLIAGMICGIIAYFFNLLYYNVINPGFANEALEYSKAAMEKMGVAMTEELEEQLKQNVEKSASFSLWNLGMQMIGQLVIWSLLGVILGAIFSKKNPKEAF